MSQQRPQMLAASARSRGEFCASFSEGDQADNPHSYIITYVEDSKQPWSRQDVHRKINSITRNLIANESQSYCAISSFGDVYFLNKTDSVHEYIFQLLVRSFDDSMTSIAFSGETLISGGRDLSLYSRSPSGAWEKILIELPPNKMGFAYGTVRAIAGLSINDLYVCVSLMPGNEPVGDDLLRRIEEAAKSGDSNLVNRLYQSVENPQRVEEGILLHFNGHAWKVAAIPKPGPYYDAPAVLNDIFIETADRIWVVGLGGTILLGNAREGFKDVSFSGDKHGLLSITKFQGQMIIASDYGLHRFDGHLLSPLKPKIDPFINRNVPTPLKVQAVGDVMFYFDYKHGVHRWDGTNWEEIAIPPELLEREFNGLR